MSLLWHIFSLFSPVHFSVLKGNLVMTKNASSSLFSASRQVHFSQSTLDSDVFVSNLSITFCSQTKKHQFIKTLWTKLAHTDLVQTVTSELKYRLLAVTYALDTRRSHSCVVSGSFLFISLILLIHKCYEIKIIRYTTKYTANILRQLNSIKYSRASSLVRWMNGGEIKASRTICDLEALIYSPFRHMTRLLAR